MKLAVVFPGIGYHVDKPLLYYSKKIAASYGFEIVEVPYGGFGSGIKGNAQKMEEAFRSALEQAEEILKEVGWNKYDQLLFLSKSVGTVVAAAFAQNHGLKTANVYYTPVEATFSFITNPGIAFHGTKDPWAETAAIKNACAAIDLPLYLTKGANHSLETGDVKTDLENIQTIMAQTQAYIQSL